jgi:hypothetical protein
VKTRSLERESSNSSPRPFIHVHVSREFCFSSNIPLSDRLKFSGGEKILKKDFFCIGHLLALRKKRIKKRKKEEEEIGSCWDKQTRCAICCESHPCSHLCGARQISDTSHQKTAIV